MAWLAMTDVYGSLKDEPRFAEPFAKWLKMLAEKGVVSVASEGFGAPGVVVSYTDDPEVQSGRAFAARGTQIAAGVPLQCDEPAGFSTFRLGLFGLDKLADVSATVARLEKVLDEVV